MKNNLQEQISRIKSMMGLIFEDTEEKCVCFDGTKSSKCCKDPNDIMDDEPMPMLKPKELDINISKDDEITTDIKTDGIDYYSKLEGIPSDLIEAMKKNGMVNRLEIAHFLAQCKTESDNFMATTEYGSGNAYEGRKDLGNTSPGDGVKYKGRGYLQITGKANYESFNKYLKEKGITDDVVKNPELLATKYPADVSIWYWSVLGPKYNKDFPDKAREGESTEIVDKIGAWVNGQNPPNGYKERRKSFKEIMGMLNDDVA
jgi:predicted chitinase